LASRQRKSRLKQVTSASDAVQTSILSIIDLILLSVSLERNKDVSETTQSWATSRPGTARRISTQEGSDDDTASSRSRPSTAALFAATTRSLPTQLADDVPPRLFEPVIDSDLIHSIEERPATAAATSPDDVCFCCGLPILTSTEAQDAAADCGPSTEH
jgi:hypothetical protein